MNTLKNYYELCKPNVVLMMLITALVGSLLASKTLPPISLIAFAMLGIALCASSAAAINQIKEAAICCSSLRVFINILKLSLKLIYMKTINRFSNHTIFIQTNN